MIILLSKSVIDPNTIPLNLAKLSMIPFVVIIN